MCDFVKMQSMFLANLDFTLHTPIETIDDAD